MMSARSYDFEMQRIILLNLKLANHAARLNAIAK